MTKHKPHEYLNCLTMITLSSPSATAIICSVNTERAMNQHCSKVGEPCDGKPAKASSDSLDSSVKLQRSLGLVSATALIVGSVIGSGIFISPKGVLQGTGSVALSLIVWSIGGIISILGALSYAELGTLIPKAGGEYTYLLESYGSLRKDVGPIPAFLHSWLSTIIIRPSSLAIVSLTLADNAIHPFFSPCPNPLLASKCIAAAVIGIITFINCYSVKVSTSVVNAFTAAKLLAIAIIIVSGLVKLCRGSTMYLATGFEGTSASAGSIAVAFYNAMWAYGGWDNINLVAEEIINPGRNLPLSLVIAIPLVIVCYMLVNVAYMAVLSTSEILASEAVAVTFGERVLGPMSWCIPMFIVLSTFGSANSGSFCGARICFAAARNGHLAKVLSYIHIENYSPIPAIIFNAILAILMIIPSNIGGLINFSGFTNWLGYCLVMTSLIVLRHTHPHLPRPYKVPLVIPIIMIIVSVSLVVTPLVEDPQLEYIYVIFFIVIGLAFYIPFVHYKFQFQVMDKVTCFLQLVLDVVPPTTCDEILSAPRTKIISKE